MDSVMVIISYSFKSCHWILMALVGGKQFRGWSLTMAFRLAMLGGVWVVKVGVFRYIKIEENLSRFCR